MAIKYVSVRPKDKVVIDLGGWGLTVRLDAKSQYYHVEYVKIKVRCKGVKTTTVQADLIASRKSKKSKFDQADSVRVWRHRVR